MNQLTMVDQLTSTDLCEALRQRHPATRGEWLFFEELRGGTGFGSSNEQRIDAFALSCWGRHQERIAYEIKVSRSDWLRELKKPRKRAMARRYSTQFYFVAPKGLIKVEELPPDAGLVEVWRHSSGDMCQRTAVKAPEVDGYPPTWRFVASLIRAQRRERT